MVALPSSAADPAVLVRVGGGRGAPEVGEHEQQSLRRGAWARVTVDQFRRLALQAGEGHGILSVARAAQGLAEGGTVISTENHSHDGKISL